MSMIANNQIGKFSIPLEVLRENHVIVGVVLATTIVVRAEASVVRNCIDYEAFSDAFAPVEAGLLPPVYDMDVSDDNDVSWKPLA